MNMSAVQQERGPRRRNFVNRRSAKTAKRPKTVSPASGIEKVHRELFSLPSTTTTTAAASSITTNEALPGGHREMLVQILLTCLKQAQTAECFRSVSKHQRNVILQSVWSELFVLKASHWPIDIVAAVESCGDGRMLDIVSATKTLSADLMELSLLEILILSRPECAVDDDQRRKLQFNSENALAHLELYVSQRNVLVNTDAERAHSVMRFGKLLLGLRYLSLHLYESSLNNLFRDIATRNFQLD